MKNLKDYRGLKITNENQVNFPNLGVWNKELEKYFGQANDYTCPFCLNGDRIDGIGMNQEELTIHLFYKHEKYGQQLVNYFKTALMKKAHRNNRKFIVNNKVVQDIIKHGRMKLGIIPECRQILCPCEFSQKNSKDK